MDLKQRYVAAMVLSGVGDALGYKNGSWEFCHSGTRIHKEAEELGGVENIEVKPEEWPVSDDTVLHLATAEALAEYRSGNDKEKLYAKIAENYKEGMKDMAGRAPGPTTIGSCSMLKPSISRGYEIPFDPRGGGCGGAMRAMCIGLRFSHPLEIDDLIAVGVESGRMTHHHPTGYLGSVAAALFTAYAIQGKPISSWGSSLVNGILPKALQYVKDRQFHVAENLKAWDYFTDKWTHYLSLRNLTDGTTEPNFPEEYGIKERDKFYKSLSFDGWGGASGHDAPMIAYDAFLSSKGDWKELCSRAMFHSGDSDSTAVMAACWYGAMYGFSGVPECNYRNVEYRSRLEKSALAIYSMSHQDAEDAESPSKIARLEDAEQEEIAKTLPNVPSNDDLPEEFRNNEDEAKIDLKNITDEQLAQKLEPIKAPVENVPESSGDIEAEVDVNDLKKDQRA